MSNKKLLLSRQDNIKIYEDTRKIALASNFPIEPTIKYNLDSTILDINVNKSESLKPEVLVIANDSFSAVELENTSSARILVLNMANGTTPGGGVSYGSFSQEENLFRRSNYFMTLFPDFYPISLPKRTKIISEGILYSPTVTVFKDENYDLLNVPFQVSCLAVAANFRPKKVVKDGLECYLDPKDKELMRLKINCIFRVAILHKHRVLVLSALGCGAFENPVDDVIELFNEAIKVYGKFFDKIVFAVRSHKDRNYDTFKKGIITS
jgi:uncharacterized protein (TIGR02452 family)